MEEELLFKLLGNIGVPAAIAFYVLFGVNKTLNKQNEMLQKLTDAVNKLNTDFDCRLIRLEDKVRSLCHTINKN